MRHKREFYSIPVHACLFLTAFASCLSIAWESVWHILLIQPHRQSLPQLNEIVYQRDRT